MRKEDKESIRGELDALELECAIVDAINIYSREVSGRHALLGKSEGGDSWRRKAKYRIALRTALAYLGRVKGLDWRAPLPGDGVAEPEPPPEFHATCVAAEGGDLQRVQQFLRASPDLASSRRGELLICAAYNADNRDMIPYLLDQGADVNASDSFGETALHVAATSEAPEIARILIDRGARVDSIDRGGDTPLHHAAGSSDCAEMIELLVESGADPEARNHRLETPLFSLSDASVDNLDSLLRSGACIDAVDERSRRSLHHAARDRATLLIRSLVEAGANPNQPDNDGNTPLHLVCRAELSREGRDGAPSEQDDDFLEELCHCARVLVSKGALPGTRNSRGEDLVAYARRLGLTRAAERLEDLMASE